MRKFWLLPLGALLALFPSAQAQQANFTIINGVTCLLGSACTVSGGSGTFNALTGDATSTSTGGATTVKGINSTLLSSLATGILKNTTSTGVPSIAASSDVISLWTGTCSSSTYLNGAGACATPSSSGLSGMTAGQIPIAATATTVTSSVTAPAGAIVGTTDTQTLTNKTLDGVTPTTMGYVDPTSSIQTQLNGKQASGSYATLGANTFTGSQTISAASNAAVYLTQTGGGTSWAFYANGVFYGFYDVPDATTPVAIGKLSLNGNNTTVFGWTNNASAATSAVDTGFSRVSADVAALGNGTAGNASGTLEAANYVAGLGGLFETTHGLNATAGVSTLSSGTVTVSTTAIAALAAAGAAGDVVELTLQSCSTCGTLSVGTVTPGTSFVINSTNVLDASNVYWEIKKLN